MSHSNLSSRLVSLGRRRPHLYHEYLVNNTCVLLAVLYAACYHLVWHVVDWTTWLTATFIALCLRLLVNRSLFLLAGLVQVRRARRFFFNKEKVAQDGNT